MSDQSQSYSINDVLNDHILLNLFKCLNSKEMVDLKLVCSQWNQIIDNNLSLWQILDLPDGGMDEWNSNFINMFEEKNGGNFKEIHIGVKVEDENIEELATKLENLKVLPTLFLQVTDQESCLVSLSDIHLRRGGLIDFRVLDRSAISSCASRIKISKSILKIQADSHPRPLRVLWLSQFKQWSANTNLISLSFDKLLWYPNWIKFAEKLGGNLKHLRIFMNQMGMARDIDSSPFERSEMSKKLSKPGVEVTIGEPYLPDVPFPFLMVLEIKVCNPEAYPFYVKISSNCVIVLEGSEGIIRDLPNIRELWIETLKGWKNLAARCPLLEVLRINIPKLSLESQSSLVELLKRRERNVQNGVRAQTGVRSDEIRIEMVSLKTLVVAFDQLEDSMLESMKELVKEVVDWKGPSKYLEIK